MVEPNAAGGFEAVILPNADAAFRLALWLLRDRSAAEDAAQTALLKAFTHFKDFRGDNPRAWLLSITRNVALATLAARRAEATDAPGEPATDARDPMPGPEQQSADRQDLRRVDGALAVLPAELRECLLLREVEGCSYAEIARITGAPVGTVMSRLWRARRALSEALARERDK